MKRRILYGVLSLVVAFALWSYVVTNVSLTADREYKNLTVTIEGESILWESNLMVVPQELPKQTLNLEGNRKELDKLTESNIVLLADVSKIYEAGSESIRLVPSYPENVDTNGISILNQQLPTVTLEIVERAEKKIPVEAVYTGTLPESYIADKENKELSVNEISIVGPKSGVETISVAQIEVNLDDRTENINEDFQIKLCKRNGKAVDAKFVTAAQEMVSLSLRIARIKEIPLNLNVIDGGGATKDTAEIVIEPKTVGISGKDSLLEGIEGIDLGTINLGEILRDTELTFPIAIPEGVINESGVTDAKVTVRFSELATKTVTVTNFKTVNVPKKHTAKLITQALEVQVRGPKDIVENIEGNNLTALVDFSDTQAGAVKIKVEITSDVSNIGAVGTYTVSATVAEPEK